MTTALASGDLAYFDSFAGLIPCRIQRVIHDERTGAKHVTVELTANRAAGLAYKRGTWHRTTASRVIPRNHVYVRYGEKHIRGSWEFVTDSYLQDY